MKFLIVLAAILAPINAHAFLSGGSSGGGGGGAVDSVNGQTGVVTLGTDEVAEGATNRYYSDALCRAAVLTGYSSAAGTVAATDTILQAFNKLNGNDGLDAKKASNLSDLASASTARTNLGLGSAAVLASSAVAQTANNLSDLASASTARTNLGLGTSAVTASTAYLNLAGQAGGQLASGGTASGDDLKLASTTHGTKGQIFLSGDGSSLADTIVIDESTASPHMCFGVASCSSYLFIDNPGDDYAHTLRLSGSGAQEWMHYVAPGGTYSVGLVGSGGTGLNFTATGKLLIASAAASLPDSTVGIKSSSGNTASASLSVTKMASQTGDAFRFTDEDGTTDLFKVDVAGTVVTSAGNESTGAGTALLGTNSPAVTNSAPYTWIKMKTSDGSTVFVPAWK